MFMTEEHAPQAYLYTVSYDYILYAIFYIHYMYIYICISIYIYI